MGPALLTRLLSRERHRKPGSTSAHPTPRPLVLSRSAQPSAPRCAKSTLHAAPAAAALSTLSPCRFPVVRCSHTGPFLFLGPPSSFGLSPPPAVLPSCISVLGLPQQIPVTILAASATHACQSSAGRKSETGLTRLRPRCQQGRPRPQRPQGRTCFLALSTFWRPFLAL